MLGDAITTDAVNLVQRTLLFAWAATAAGMTLFPPFHLAAGEVSRFVGYRFIGEPVLIGGEVSDYASIDVERYVVQFAGCAVSYAALVLATQGKRAKGSS